MKSASAAAPRSILRPNAGLTLAESKKTLAGLQHHLLHAQTEQRDTGRAGESFVWGMSGEMDQPRGHPESAVERAGL